MKTTINSFSCLLFAFLFMSQLSLAQQTKKAVTNISMLIFNHNAEINQGFWSGSIEEDAVCIQIIDSKNKTNPSFVIAFCLPKEEFTFNTSGGFELIRSAGTIKFQGTFPNDSANGDFTFVKNRDFKAFLEEEGIQFNDDNFNYYFKLFLGDITKDYVLGLKRHGYQPSLKQLGKLGIHRVDLDYINAISDTQYKNLELELLIKFVIHDVSISYIKDLEKAGYGEIDANMVKKFAIHDVSIAYINGLSELGYEHLDPNMIKNFAVHDISLKYIKGLSSVGFKNLDPKMLKNFAVHDISPNYIKSLRDTGIKITNPNTLKKAKMHGLTANYINKAMTRGHNSNELADYIKLKIHGK